MTLCVEYRFLTQREMCKSNKDCLTFDNWWTAHKETHHEELTQSDVGENVVGFIFATSHSALLPEVGELVL